MSEQKLIAWRGNGGSVSLNVSPRPSETERCRSALGCYVGGIDVGFACERYGEFLLFRSD